MKVREYFLSFILILPIFLISFASAEQRIRCASTTSTQNSGLFDYILPLFEKKAGIKVDVVAVGTGAAIEIGKRGDADVVFVHAKEQELKAVEEGWFVNRYDVMYNDFIIIGPSDDPIQIKGTRFAVEAFRKIAESSFSFVSRGDKSGTHTKELSIWQKTGINPKPHTIYSTNKDENYPSPIPLPQGEGVRGRVKNGIFVARGEQWYLEVGQGMEKTQRIANEKRAYTLTDRGTWLATKDKDKLDMAIVLESDSILFNQYGVMAVNPEKHSHVKYKEAMEFVNWLVSKEGQEAIASFKDKNGNQLFIPNAK
ncbi:MAG: extracellular solute-binding protein [Thermodesulfovibrionia bacterium]|nr:extracellular solute-binding protein [Thermodesulfovibrionia bacterium]